MCVSNFNNNFSVYSWNQVLQEVDYEILDIDCHSISSLFELCCKPVVSDGQFFKQVLPYIPISFYPILMKYALKNGRRPSIQLLLNAWPFPTFCLSSLIKPIYPYIQSIYNEDDYFSPQQHHIHTSYLYTSYLINSFINYLSNYSNLAKSKLRILDLRGFPIGDDKIYYIIKVILTSCGESEKTINYFIEQEKNHFYFNSENKNYYYKDECPFSIRCKTKLDFDSILNNQPKKTPSIPYKIKVDCVISETSKLLVYMLQSNEFLSSPLKLELYKIGLSGLNIEKLQFLLNSLPTYIVKGLSLSYSSLQNEGFKRVIHILKLFFNLTTLDLSYNNINLTTSAFLELHLCKTFKSFEYLQRLDLSNNRLTGYLKTILSCIGDSRFQETNSAIAYDSNENKCSKKYCHRALGLQYLRVSGCRLCKEDIDSLAESHHTFSLKELDISDNNFSQFVKSIEKLLEVLKNKLYILEIEECCFNPEQLSDLTKILSEFSKLRYLNYAKQKQMNFQEINNQLKCLQLCESLKIIRISRSTIVDDLMEQNCKENERRVIDHLI